MLRAACLAAVIFSPAVARANVGPRTLAGDPAGEPRGIRGIAIAGEELVIDLRPLADRDLARISATYRVVNNRDAQRLALVFVTGSRDVDDFTVAIDGKAIGATARDTHPLPSTWQPPRATPGFDGGAPWPYEVDRDAVAVDFTVSVPPGSHVLAASYRALAMCVVRPPDTPTVIYQLAYVLAPARAWDGFGGLDATIRVPVGWRIAVAPAFVRDGDLLRARFARLPADAIAITTQARPGAAYQVVHTGGRILALVVLVVGIPLLARRGARRARTARSPGGGLGGFVWSAALATSSLLAFESANATLPASQASHGYGPALATIGGCMVALVAWPIGALVTRIAWNHAKRS